MKRLMMVVGVLGSICLVAAALQHSPPAQDNVLTLKAAPVVALAPVLVSAPATDLMVFKVMVGQHVLVPTASLRNLAPVPRPTWRGNLRYTLSPNARTRHVSNTSMRGWGFL